MRLILGASRLFEAARDHTGVRQSPRLNLHHGSQAGRPSETPPPPPPPSALRSESSTSIEAALELALDTRAIIRLGIVAERALPLENGLPACGRLSSRRRPDDHLITGVIRQEVNGSLKLFDGLVVATVQEN